MQDCIFCRIAAREAPAFVAYEDDDTIAFLDIHPVAEGHTLVTPKRHFVSLDDVPEALLGKVIRTCKIISERIISSGIGKGTNLYQANHAAADQSVFHLHFHVVPRNSGDGNSVIGFWQNSVKHIPDARMKEIRDSLIVEG